jgi:hypothetical protein
MSKIRFETKSGRLCLHRYMVFFNDGNSFAIKAHDEAEVREKMLFKAEAGSTSISEVVLID